MSLRSRTIVPTRISLKDWKKREYFLPGESSQYDVAKAMIYVEIENEIFIKVKIPKESELFVVDVSDEEGSPCFYVAIDTKGEPDTGKWTYIDMKDLVHEDETKVQIFCSKIKKRQKILYMGLVFLNPKN